MFSTIRTIKYVREPFIELYEYKKLKRNDRIHQR